MDSKLRAKLTKLLDDEGYRLISHSQNDFSVHTITFKMKDDFQNPPDLGIHIRDGMGTKDKVGG